MKYTQHWNIGTWHWKHATWISLDKSSITLTTVWQKEQLTATVVPPDASDKVTWSSSNTSIATVNQSWLVTCVTPWECTITATVNGYSATCEVVAQVMPTSWLLGYRKLEEDFNDYSGNSRNWTQGGSVSFTTFGGYKCANVWNGVWYIDTPLSYNQLPLTMCIWSYLNSWWDNYRKCMIWNHWTGSDNTLNYEIRNVESKIDISVWSSSSYRSSSAIAPAWSWDCWVVTIDSSATKLYKNWTLQQTFSWWTTWSNVWNWTIWRRLSWSGQYHWWYWYLRQAAVYNRALSASEVLDYYNGTK